MSEEVHTVLPSGEVCVLCQGDQKETRSSTWFFAETGIWYTKTGTTMWSLPYSPDWLTQRCLLTINVKDLCCIFGSIDTLCESCRQLRCGQVDGMDMVHGKTKMNFCIAPLVGTCLLFNHV